MQNTKCPYCNDSLPFGKCDKVTFKTHLDEHCGESVKEVRLIDSLALIEAEKLRISLELPYVEEYINKLLQQQATFTKKETINECIDVISKYKEFVKGIHEKAHKNNWNMFLYDAHSRLVACDHILEKIKLLIKLNEPKTQI